MKFKVLCGCAVFLFAVATGSAQTKITLSGKCDKPTILQSVPVGDMDGHAFVLDQGKCATMGEVGGAKSKEGMYSERGEMRGTHAKVWGFFLESYDSGDKIFYTYQSTGTMTTGGGVSKSTNSWQMVGGTGKMKGIKGSGTCESTGNANGDGGDEFTCTGTYTLATAAPAM
jgi:hypothetical protein